MDSDAVCVAFNKKESDSSKLLTCLYCFTSVHIKCKGITGVAVRRVKENPYYCSPNWTNIYQKIIEMQDNKSTVVQAMTAELKASLSSAVSAEMQAVWGEVKSITSAIETSQEFLSSKFDSIASEFKELKIENAYLKNELSDLKHSHSALTQTVYRLEEVVDKTNKAGMLNNAVLLGVPTQMNENVNELAIKTVGEMGLNLPDGSILSASRMSANTKIP